MNRWLTLALLIAAGAGLLLRWPGQGQRPMHNDEAVNGVKLLQLWSGSGYRYDPDEHHGPTLYYITAGLAPLVGIHRSSPSIQESLPTEAALRMVTVIFGLGVILLLPAVHDGLGRAGVFWAAFLVAVSPAFVFYSQYFIHEMLFAFFTAATIAAAWRYWRTRKRVWALLAGAAFGLMAATKETFVLSVFAAGVAILANQIWNRYLDATGPHVRAQRLNWWHVSLGAGVALLVSAMLFTSFFQNWQGLADAVKTYEPWLKRAGGESPHIHAAGFYFHRLLWFRGQSGVVWTEASILVLALVGMTAAFRRKGLADESASFLRFVSIYSFALAGIYSLIPYKTPWCLLTFWYGVILVGGAGAGWLIRRANPTPRRVAVAVLLTAAVTHLSAEAWRSVRVYSFDRGNPYVYAQTLPGAVKLVDRIRAVAPDRRTLIKVVSPDSDYWPLPWYLAQYKHTGWYDILPKDPYAPVMVVSSRLNAELDSTKTHLMTGYYELRPGVFLELYVDLNLWKEFLARKNAVP